MVSRRFADNLLESFKPMSGKSLGNITAAAITGPANGPLPASSIPATLV